MHGKMSFMDGQCLCIGHRGGTKLAVVLLHGSFAQSQSLDHGWLRRSSAKKDGLQILRNSRRKSGLDITQNNGVDMLSGIERHMRIEAFQLSTLFNQVFSRVTPLAPSVRVFPLDVLELRMRIDCFQPKE